MSKKQQLKTEKPPQDFEVGKTYLAKADIWAIDYQSHTNFMIVYARDQQFKVKPGDLILLDNGAENE